MNPGNVKDAGSTYYQVPELLVAFLNLFICEFDKIWPTSDITPA